MVNNDNQNVKASEFINNFLLPIFNNLSDTNNGEHELSVRVTYYGLNSYFSTYEDETCVSDDISFDIDKYPADTLIAAMQISNMYQIKSNESATSVFTFSKATR